MKERCLSQNCKEYERYGGRGICICNEWNDFEAFYTWAVSNGYTDKLTLDRVDVNGNYEPSNCRWATQVVQQNNRRNNKKYSFNGLSYTLPEWSRITGINKITLWYRINKYGWSIERALTTYCDRRRQ